MKRILTLCLAIIGLSYSLTAHPVDQETARAVASEFMANVELQLVTTYRTGNNDIAFYVFNAEKGYVIVSADDCETPIIGYSHEGHFNPDDVPVQMEAYLQDFVERIQYGIENHLAADEITARQWALVKSTGRLNDGKATKAVTPLLNERWSQGCYYNSLCPAIGSSPCGHAEVGCVAVAMGQIMHYWRYPSQGWGSHSYNNSGAVLSADFGNTDYDWDHMPDSLTDSSNPTEIAAVATLLYHCGVSVEMEYGTNGSGASSNMVPDALARYFNYSRRLHREKRANYSDEEWLSLLKDCLDAQRPVFYSGSGNGSHAFVCDGYDDNDMLHFNWGWSGNHNGYFALGNLNPNGYNFSSNNFAILDIVPQYEPWLVDASVYPPSFGTVEGMGEYHIGEQCTLTAVPGEDYEFYCWKRNGIVIANTPTLTLGVEDDILDLEANFSCLPVGEITASQTPSASQPDIPEASLTWSRADTEWTLLKQFDIHGESGGLATDGKHIYVTYAAWNDPPFMFEKYTMDGELVETFNLEGLPDALALAYDGTYFYCNSLNSIYFCSILYRLDLDHKTVIDSTNMGLWFGTLAYDPEYDGFWFGKDYQTLLYDRQGQVIKISPTLGEYINGLAYYTANDGTPHLLITRPSGVYNYDINNNFIHDHPFITVDDDFTIGLGACVGRYDGKDALFFIVDNTVRIYEIKSALEQIPQIVSYRIYRSDDEGNITMIAEEVTGSSYVDTTWHAVYNGEYRYGISEVFANGMESGIIWSEPIVKTNYGIPEIPVPQNSDIRKVVEDGHLYIIVNGKRYSVTGQAEAR